MVGCELVTLCTVDLTCNGLESCKIVNASGGGGGKENTRVLSYQLKFGL